MKLNDFAAWVDQRRHLRDFLFEVIDIGLALGMIQRDDRGAAAEPAKRFTERNVKINREVARCAVVVLDLRGELLPRHGVGEPGRGRIAGVTRPGHIVFFHQLKIDVQRFHTGKFNHRLTRMKKT